MIAARLPVQRPSNAKVLTVDGQGNIEHKARSEFADLLPWRCGGCERRCNLASESFRTA
jgi:hypothetical protein